MDSRGLGLDLRRGGCCFEEPDTESVKAPNIAVLPLVRIPQYLWSDHDPRPSGNLRVFLYISSAPH